MVGAFTLPREPGLDGGSPRTCFDEQSSIVSSTPNPQPGSAVPRRPLGWERSHQGGKTCWMTDEMTAARTVRRAIDSCYARGLNLTPLRRRVLEVVAAATTPVSAIAIAERLSDPARHLAPQAVYPTMDFLMEAALVRHVGLRKAYVCCDPHTAGDCAILLVCTACDCVSEIAAEPLRACINRTASLRRFVSGRRPMEIEGLCSACQG